MSLRLLSSKRSGFTVLLLPSLLDTRPVVWRLRGDTLATVLVADTQPRNTVHMAKYFL